jgi:DNA polymerase III delta subunit
MAELIYNSVSKKPGQFPPAPLPSVILLVGADDAMKREAMVTIRSVALDESFADFDQETIDLSLGSAAEDAADPVTKIAEAAGAVPFASPRRVVTVVSVQKLTKERQEALASLLPRLSSLCLVLLVADASEMEAGRPKGKQVELGLRKAAAKSGMVLVCDAPEGADLRSRASDIIALSGKTCEPAVIDMLLAAASFAGQNGADLNSLKHEAAKLVDYVGPSSQRITKEDASAVLPVQTDENIFRLLDAVGARDISRSMQELGALLMAEGKPDATAARLIVMLQRHFRLLMLAKFLSDRRLIGKNPLPDDVKELLSGELAGFATGQAYRLNGYAKQASNFHWDDLRRGSGRIMAADLMLKGIKPGIKTMARQPDFGDDATSTLRLLIYDLCVSDK